MMNSDPFKDYIEQSEPDKRDMGYVWHIAIQNIEGKISIYNDLKNGVHETTESLELFLRNLLLDEKICFIIVQCISAELFNPMKKRTFVKKLN